MAVAHSLMSTEGAPGLPAWRLGLPLGRSPGAPSASPCKSPHIFVSWGEKLVSEWEIAVWDGLASDFYAY